MAKPKNPPKHVSKDAELEESAKPSSSPEKVESPVQSDDYENHPKFAKFKQSQGGN